jgi:2-keto-3-deoxy-L-rhamnonate aldolase RhmA
MSSSTPKNFVAKIRSQDGPLIGTVLSMPSVTAAQIAAQTAADFVMIDMEHAPLPMDIVTQMVHAYVQTSRGTKFPIVRIPSHSVEWVKWALDSGCAGIIIPMVSNAAEMGAIIDRAIYPPGGRRSFGPFYAPLAHPDGPGAPGSGVGTYVQRAQRGEIAILPMIESKEGLENVEAILGLEHVSGCFVGPADLRVSVARTLRDHVTGPLIPEVLAWHAARPRWK